MKYRRGKETRENKPQETLVNEKKNINNQEPKKVSVCHSKPSKASFIISHINPNLHTINK